MRVVLVAIYVAPLGIAARLLVSVDDRSLFPWYVALLAVFFLLFSLVWIRQRMHAAVLVVVFVLQSAVIVTLIAFEPEYDYVADLFVMLAFQAAVVFRGRTRQVWIAAFVLLMLVPPMVLQGPLHGLSLALTRVAIAIALAALAVTSQEIESARNESVEMLSRLESANEELKKYAAEVDDLAALQERNRLARDLHDSVSQAMFGILLAVRSTQLMREKETEGIAPQLELLQGLTQDALARMRGFIAELRPRA